ncbi:hypothetical protein QBC41DRAFT_348490 [Cercophora samala]|uniref:Uncharacterized protein n=1 Tax=Cercophora samala TaxID=330535 RepID=A0AA39ZAA9_9PEZI|nr:hypothetical protein QBC41DRAFT_348490 [Cercophora samala]
MTPLTLHLAALLLFTAPAQAAPTSPTNASSTVFSWSQWVEDIIANPDTALTPDAAVEAATAAAVAASAGGLQKRAPDCAFPAQYAPGRDAAACLDYLTRIGQQGTMCGMPSTYRNIQMCRIGRAEVVGSQGTYPAPSTDCINVARTGGLIFDGCWRAGDIVKGSEVCVNNGMLTVRIGGL